MMPDCTDRSPAAGKIGDAVFAAQGIKVLQYKFIAAAPLM